MSRTNREYEDCYDTDYNEEEQDYHRSDDGVIFPRQMVEERPEMAITNCIDEKRVSFVYNDEICQIVTLYWFRLRKFEQIILYF